MACGIHTQLKQSHHWISLKELAVTMQRLGILGFGSFGRFAAVHLSPHFEVLASDLELPEIHAEREPLLSGVKAVAVEEAAACEVVVIAVPVQNMESLICSLASYWTPGALVIEVASVKERPARILERCLPEGVRSVGLHPMFGPQSGKHGIKGLKVVQTLVSHSPRSATKEQHSCVRRLLEKLGLVVIPMAAADHDREMAYIQGLTHWIAKALREVRLPNVDLATPAYRHLLSIEEILREDSPELFLTIQRENRFAGPARAELLKRLADIEASIDGDDEP